MKTAIVGAGASGVIAALSCKSKEIILIDGNDKSLKKILLTGNGRCNYWNEYIDIDKYNTDNYDILQKIISKENINKTYEFLYKLGIYPKIKNNNYYPYSNQASSVRQILEKNLTKKNIKFINNFKVNNIYKINDEFIIESTNNEKIKCDKLILATGSKAYPKTGSDGSGYELLKKFNLKINPVTPALTKLFTKEKYLWENVRSDVNIKLYVNNEFVKEEYGEVQLTMDAISGICTFNLSSIASKSLYLKKNVYVKIDFLPNIPNIIQFLDDRQKIINGNIEEILESIFNYKLMFVLLKYSNINKEKRWDDLSLIEKNILSKNIKEFKLNIIGTDTFDKSQVCTGGLSLNYINPKSMSVNDVNGLYVVGEILDVDGMCGGFNLAFAFITGYLAGSDIND